MKVLLAANISYEDQRPPAKPGALVYFRAEVWSSCLQLYSAWQLKQSVRKSRGIPQFGQNAIVLVGRRKRATQMLGDNIKKHLTYYGVWGKQGCVVVSALFQTVESTP